jgi:hypothetical protein
MARVMAGVVGPLLRLVAFPIDFFFSWSSIPRKNDVANFLVRLTFGRSMKVKNLQKQENLLCSVKTK